MRIKPILFNTEMVQAILEGRKTVTRRICKDGDIFTIPDMSFYDPVRRTYAVHGYADLENKEQEFTAERPCPICPGDILYVRETWSFIPCICCNGEYARGMQPCYDFWAVEFDDGESISDGCFVYRADCKTPERITWRPSIHMPKEAARLWLKVTDVRVERLQAMKMDDFLNEGVIVRPEAFNDPENAYYQAQKALMNVWDSTVKKADVCWYSWSADPWVWVIEFEKCKKPEGGNC